MGAIFSAQSGVVRKLWREVSALDQGEIMSTQTKLALALCVAFSPTLLLAATPTAATKTKHHYSFGVVTTTSYHTDGSSSSTSHYFDLATYTANGKVVYLTAPPTIQTEDCQGHGSGGDPGDGDPGNGDPPPGNGNPSDNVPPSDFPPPPSTPSSSSEIVAPDLGTYTVTQTYDGWTRTTTWNRTTNYVNGQWVDGPWGPPQVSGPTHGGGHPDEDDPPCPVAN
jgi:hypothetical protein